MKKSFILTTLATLGSAAVPADLVESIPGFAATEFKTYSGYLTVPGPVAGYSSLSIAYIFNEARVDPSTAPLTTWHQGGPGGNSFYGLFGEGGYFQVAQDENSNTVTFPNNQTSWNLVSNMLYLDSPAGSNDPIGFSTCSEDGKVASVCKWNDVTQAEAYAETLLAFFKAYPEYSKNPLYLTGESYAGQYLPNIANTILTTSKYNNSIPLTGLAVGNGCWGGDATSVQCNGPNSDQNDADNYWGKGLISNAQYFKTYEQCGYEFGGKNTTIKKSLKCDMMLEEISATVGPHNVYDIYDNCPDAANWHALSGKSVHWLKTYLREHMSTPKQTIADQRRHLANLAGGYEWPCGGLDTLSNWLAGDAVRKALHFKDTNPVHFDYDTSGPASITLWPFLAKHLRVLIYNGDADDCVPYHGNEEWTTKLASEGHLVEKSSWHPWYLNENKKTIPQGYATTYTVPGSDMDFSFVSCYFQDYSEYIAIGNRKKLTMLLCFCLVFFMNFLLFLYCFFLNCIFLFFTWLIIFFLNFLIIKIKLINK